MAITTNSSRPTPATDPERDPAPEFGRINSVCTRYGLSRSGIYRLAQAGHIRLVKLGGATLVDVASIREFLATLPEY